jgi:hypothetical protein
MAHHFFEQTLRTTSTTPAGDPASDVAQLDTSRGICSTIATGDAVPQARRILRPLVLIIDPC